MRSLAICLAVLLLPAAAQATVPIDDFEDVSDWSGLTLEKTIVHQGAGAGRWANHTTTKSIHKGFAAPLDASKAKNLDLWLYSQTANGAGIELVLDSDDPATTGADYYSWALVIDWTGWKRLRLPLASFTVARTPLGWDHLTGVSLSADGWGNTPKADTLLILDDMNFDGGPIISATSSGGSWVGPGYVYSYSVLLTNGAAASRSFTLALDGGTGSPLSLSVNPSTATLAAGASTTITATLTIPTAYATAAHALQDLKATFKVLEAGADIDEQVLRGVVPFAQRAHPRTLLDSADFTRIAQWAAADPWAATVRTGILNSAADWPAGFLKKYGVGAWALPPEGGQWTLWYVCPVHGVKLKYTPPMTHTCPVDSKVYTGWPYDQVVYAWMHSDLAEKARVLGMAWRLAQDGASAQAAADILKAYADKYLSYPIHDVNGQATTSGAHVMAQTLDESSWAISIAWAYDLIADSPALTDADRAHIEKDLLREVAATIERNHAGTSNWQSWHDAALTAVGFAIDDPQLLSDALDSPTDGFELQMAQSVPGDGIWFEGSWGYHFFALSALTDTAEMAKRAGRDLFAEKPLRSMFFAPLLFAQPDLSLPSFNDDGGSSLTGNWPAFEVGYAEYGDPSLAAPLAGRNRGETSLLFGAETLPAASAPPSASALFPDSGFAVLRTGAGLSANYLAMKFGPHGGWHGHFDKLGFVLFGRGGVMGLDPGTQSYAAPTHTTWDKVTVAHNTVVVDGTTQGEATGKLHRYSALRDISMSAADGGPAYATAKLLRTLVLAGEYVVDRFHVSATDGQTHAIDWAYHDYGTLSTPLTMAPYAGLPKDNGYQNISSPQSAQTDADWTANFQVSDTSERSYGSVYANDASASGIFTQSAEQHSGGKWSGKMQYAFTTTGTYYVLYTTKTLPPINEVPQEVKLQLFGDGSKNSLTVRLMDATGERYVKKVGSIDWTGWKAIDLTGIPTWDHYLGDNNGVFDTPAQSVVIEIDQAASGAASGTLFVDDIHLVFPNAGEVTVEDFELPARALALRMLGAAGTTVVQGNGLGPDLLEPVPMLLARRQSKDTTFLASLEPYGDARAIEKLSTLTTSAVDADEALAATASGPRFSDDLLALADGAAGTRRTFGEDACDGTLCLVRRATDGSLSRLALVQGTKLEGKEGVLIQAAQSLDVQADLGAGGKVSLATGAPLSGELRVRAPATQSVSLNGQAASFVQDGAMIVLNGVPAGDAGAAPDGSLALSDAGKDSGLAASADVGVAAVDGSAGGADTGEAALTKSGCGCATSAGSLPGIALALLALGAARRSRKSEGGRAT